MRLQNMCKKRGDESFKEYAQRWRDLAAQVAPPMMEREMVIVMVDTLPVFYYENGGLHTFKLCGYGLHLRKNQSGSKKRQIWSSCFDKCQKKTGANEEGENEGEAHAVTAIPIQPSFPPTQQCHYSANKQTFSLPTAQLSTKAIPKINHKVCLPHFQWRTSPLAQSKNANQEMNFAAKSLRIHPKFWCHMLNLLSYLLDNSTVAITPARFPQPPFFWGYDLTATCAYHGVALGHSIEHCKTLKHKVQSLIDVGWLKFEENRLLNPNTDKRHHTWGNFESCC